ncbi:hypothetical protein Tco_0444124 [Tanacetum coccineum]
MGALLEDKMNIRMSCLEKAISEKNATNPAIIAKDLSDNEKTALIKVLKSRKQAIAWKLSDIKGIGMNG